MTIEKPLAELSRAIDGSFDPDWPRVVRQDASGTFLAERGLRWIRLGVRFGEPLGLELAIRRMRDEDYWEFFHNPPITFEQPDFDDALLVRGEPESSVRVLLDTETRALLLRLCHASVAIEIDRFGISFELERSSGIADVAEDLLVLARRLAGVWSIDRSAYR
jgi:hypothetical protein